MSGADGEQPEDSLSSDSQVGLPSANEQFDLTAYAVALAFNSVALPPGISDTMKDAAEARARDIRAAIEQDALTGELSEGGAREKRRKEADDRAEAQFDLVLEKQQREREEWAQSAVTVAGTTMTGADWQELSQRLRENETFRERLMQLYLARGMSAEEAEARVERVTEAAEIAAIPESQRTEEQRRTMKNNDADPSFKQDVQQARQLQTDEGPAFSASAFNHDFSSAASGTSAAQNTAASDQPATPAKSVQIDAAPF